MSTNDPVTNPGGDGERVLVTETRQGFRDKPILWVLGGGLVLVVIALFGMWALHAGPFATLEEHNGRQASDAAAFDTPLAAPKQNDIGHPSPRTGEAADTGGSVDRDMPAPPNTQNPAVR